MRIWRGQRRDGFHGRGISGLREIHREAGTRLALCGFGGLRIFELLAAVTSSDFSQTFRSGIFFGVDGGLGRSGGRCRRIIFAGFDARAILLRENLRLLQIFIRINVRVFFLLRLFARFFLARGFGNGRRIRLGILRAGRQSQQRCGCAETREYAEGW